MFAPRNVKRKPAASKSFMKRPLEDAPAAAASGDDAPKKRRSRWDSNSSSSNTATGTGLFSNLGASATFVPASKAASTRDFTAPKPAVPRPAQPAAGSAVAAAPPALAPATQPAAVPDDRAVSQSPDTAVLEVSGGGVPPTVPSATTAAAGDNAVSNLSMQGTEPDAKEIEIAAVEEPPKASVKKVAAAFDMFGDDDIFVDGPDRAGIQARDDGTRTPLELLAEDSTDKAGYYHVNPGETLNERFKVITEIGRGVFSCVLGCVDLQRASKAVAIKVIKNNETMRKAAEKEVSILQQLAKDDPNAKKHCVSMLDFFEHREHTCMVFERYEMDLRQCLKKFGRGVGIKLEALRIYGAQMLAALAQMRRLGIVHADIKPDNVLVTSDKRKIVIADFGSAGDIEECEITPYLVSRYYRAPEISIGHEYGCAIDVWAVACTVCEMYTGRFLFDGESNNHMLKLIQEVRGGLSHKMIRQSKLSAGHFDTDYTFLAQPIKKSKDKKVRKLKFDTPTRDLFAILCPPESVRRMTASEISLVQLFRDLLVRMLTLDPSKRPVPEDLLGHAFFQSKSARVRA